MSSAMVCAGSMPRGPARLVSGARDAAPGVRLELPAAPGAVPGRRHRSRALPAPGSRAQSRAGSADSAAGNGREAGEEERTNLAGVRHILLVLSGKGGVGKSTLSTELALALRSAGKRVGILDVDLCGPSIPRMLRVQDSAVHQCDSGWVPVFVGQDKAIALMSIGFLLERPDDAVVWRGPKKNALIKQFVTDVAWGELDFLIVDTPPGTSDEHISTVEALRPYQLLGAILVTTPQECTNIFSKGGGEELAKHAGVPFLGCVPLDPQLSQSLEEGRDFIQEFPKSSAFPALTHIAQQIVDTSQRSS
ncbi:cytosolic Fe-S cluster assembly factor NUBP2 isoform X2 [Parus major]|uniref:cytosolic Fe-S cluster assembly factor NUBP2 isoform X2 n=1 Tax=Parus major TaxID=9157 RepID=UPI001443C4FE|nr:cytosolic Fe-S cluster assembly factor NUBP2 isoform X2 [Parus major]